MLLPSALVCDAADKSCDPSCAILSHSPSPSPTLANIYTACRALHLILSSSTSPSGSIQLPPPARDSLILRRCPRSSTFDEREHKVLSLTPRHKVMKHKMSVSRGLRKLRLIDDELSHNATETASQLGHGLRTKYGPVICAPITPKRISTEPQELNLDSEKANFYNLENRENQVMRNHRAPTPFLHATDQWTFEEDCALVKLVLEKIKLSKDDWQQCAHSLGRDYNSIGRRWNSLITQGEIGLKKSQGKQSQHEGVV